MTLMTAMTMNYRGSLNGVGHSSEMGDGREHGEHKAVKERCPCEARRAYIFRAIRRFVGDTLRARKEGVSSVYCDGTAINSPAIRPGFRGEVYYR
jgi:hypothetical protein